MSPEAAQVWDRIITQFGKTSGLSRYVGYSIALDDRQLGLGAEYQPPQARYRWHGLERQGSAENRYICFQWTIEGEGILQVGRTVYPQAPGQAFLVPVPSDHEYRVSSTGPGWKFFYIMMSSHWLADRLSVAVRDLNYTFPLDFSSRLAVETLHFIQKAYAGGIEDRFDAEKAAFDWTVEVRRHVHQVCHPEDRREAILTQAQQFYLRNKSHSFGVEEFAKTLGLSRVRGSLHFQKLTGQTPAAYFMELRLKDAISLLGHGFKLQHVAAETGFADAHHFCKVFKRVYHVTPGQFRKMMGLKSGPAE